VNYVSGSHQLALVDTALETAGTTQPEKGL
jgi:hypothetical protein